ncbi:MAG: ROK family protein [Clostridia bacterium]|nr:ROK family protein [Clostridia bacterium]
MLMGIDIGGTKCAVVVGDENGRVLKKERFATTTCKETLENIFAAAEKLFSPEVSAIGISCGGPLDEKEGVILSPPNLPGWDNIPIVSMLKERFGVPCAICNDANAGALAEWQFGAGKGCENLVFMTFGTGLGAGLILNGALYSGSCGMAGEVGHMRLSDFGPSGYGKCGSFEGFCSGSGLYELGRGKAREYLQRGEKPTFIKDKDPSAFTVAEMAAAARTGDSCAKEVFDICAEKLGQGLSILCDLLNPEKILIGSVFERCRDLLEEGALRVMRREVHPFTMAHVTLDVPALTESIGDMAALAVAMYTLERTKKQ